MCRTFPSPLTVAAVVGGDPHAPPEGPAIPRAIPAPAPGRTCAPWGILAAIDLHGCDSGRLADPDSIRAFVPAVIDAIGMRAHGPLALERFGDGELEGWSAMQFIETSSITIHADEVSGRCFIDVFDVSLLLYPAYYCIVNGAIALLIHQRRRTLHRTTLMTAPAA